MASLDELEMVLLGKLAQSECPVLMDKIGAMLPVLVPKEHLSLMLRHMKQCEFVDLTTVHGQLFAEATSIGRTVAKTCMAELPNMEARLIKRQAVQSPPPLADLPRISIHNNFSPTIETSTANAGDKWAKSQTWASWSSVVVAIVALVVGALVVLYVEGKL